MKLYYSKGACSLAVRIIINELKMPSEFEAVDLKTKITETGADFLKINPKGEVPTLVLDNQNVLTENAVIQQYLVDVKARTDLLPAVGDFQRYRVLEWLNFITTDLHKGFGPLFNAKVPEDLKNNLFKPNLRTKFELIEKHLEGKLYLLGENFTLPDAYLFVILRWFYHMKIELASATNLSRYFALLKTRPSIEQSLKQEGLF